MNDVFWIAPAVDGERLPLAIVLRPRGGDWLEGELHRLKRSGIQTLVSMLEPWEAEYLGLGIEGELANQAGLTFFSYPIADRETPSNIHEFRHFLIDIADRLRTGERIGVHCRGCIGRATIMAACALIHLGWNPMNALAAIETTRGCPVPDTEEQRNWILRYEAAA